MRKVLLFLCFFGAICNSIAQNKSEVISLTKSEFLTKVFNYEKNTDQWVYEGDKPCIIDFYTDWCGPCKKVAPILAELAEKYKGKIIVYKVHAEKEIEIARVFGVSAYPTFWFIPVKGEPKRAMGALPKADFETVINDFLLQKSPTVSGSGSATSGSAKKK